MVSRRWPAIILAVTLLLLGMGTVRGLMARGRPSYPCAFQKHENGRWIGKLSLSDANSLRAKSVRVGETIGVRLNDVSWADAPFMIRCVARAYGMDPAPFLSVAKCESGMNPKNDSHPTFKGLYQYHPDTWRNASVLYGHKGASIFDGYSQTHVTVQSVRDGGWGPWPVCGV